MLNIFIWDSIFLAEEVENVKLKFKINQNSNEILISQDVYDIYTHQPGKMPLKSTYTT